MNLLTKKSVLAFCLAAIVGSTFASGYQSITQKEIKAYYKDLPFDMPMVKPPVFKKNSVKITDFGAVGDGVTLNTDAFEKAIDAISKKGGGTVVVPAGIWLTGPIVLRSNINLFTERNSMVLFSPDFDLYPIVDASFEGLNTKRCQSPLSAKNAENIAITGYGVFDGSGGAWRPVKREKMTDKQFSDLQKRGGVLSADKKMWFPSVASLKAHDMCEDQNVPVGPTTDAEWQEIRDYLRPVLLSFVSCKNILLEGVTFQNSPAWNLHPLMCENIIVNRINVRNPWFSQNGDGIDIESCKNTLIVNSSFDVGDDAICMKSGKNEDGRARGIPTENVIVANCVVYHGHGGFVVGSEMSGDIRNISVKSCSFIGTNVGLRFKSTRGRGGVVENIYIDGINMINIPTDPLTFDLFYGGKAPGEEDESDTEKGLATVPPVTIETPAFKDIYIRNVTSNGSNRAMYFNGLPEMKVQNIVVENSVFTSRVGAVINRVNGVKFKNLVIENSVGEILTLGDVDNVTIENFTNSKGQKQPVKQVGTNTNVVIK